MARKPKESTDAAAYVHPEPKRLNNPEAGNLDLAPKTRETRKTYNYDPRETPVLMWADKAGLTRVESREALSFAVPVVNLHIHERVAPEAIIRAVRREDAQRSLFADPQLDGLKELQFYQHPVDWSNRMILGDSLQVMASLLEREGMRGKVQMIYLDPPYGIKFGSNFQPKIDRRDVKDGADDDLTREVEQVQAFRDTWELGVHSYLSYLRDRLILARELLSDSGSVFVQIGDENVHRVRCLLDEVFGDENFVAEIAVTKTTGLGSDAKLAGRLDFLLWFSRDIKKLYFQKLYAEKEDPLGSGYSQVELPTGERRSLTKEEREAKVFPGRLFMSDNLTKPGPGSKYEIEYHGQVRTSKNRWWGMEKTSLERLLRAGRGILTESTLRYLRYFDDSPASALNNLWTGLGGAKDPQYVVQTNEEIIKRCVLMTSKPGDLVLDPTCGSGTTAFVAEQWGRRWITCDTSRVALSIARHRLMTASYNYYRLRFPSSGISGGLRFKQLRQITAESIAQNAEIDAITAELQPLIDQDLAKLNEVRVTHGLPSFLEWTVPLVEGENEFDVELENIAGYLDSRGIVPKSALLKAAGNDEEEMWSLAIDVFHHYYNFWRAKREMQAKIDASIQRNAPQEELVDQPEVERNVVRVTGPFTVEAVPNVSEISAEVHEKIFGDELQMTVFEPAQTELTAQNVSAYLGDMIEKLRKSGVVTKGKGRLTFTTLRALAHETLHAEGELGEGGLRCAVVFGPENGSVSELLLHEAVRASRRYDALLVCGYDFTGPAQEIIQESRQKDWQLFMAYIAPDTVMTDLLKDTKASQLFAMVGEPDVVTYQYGETDLSAKLDDAKRRNAQDVLERAKTLQPGEVFIELRGVDLYNPIKGEVTSEGAGDVHAIFVDHDYDGKSFCICQALFPNKRDSWTKIERALKGAIDEDAFEAFRTHVSLPFRPGENRKVQVKVIDTRGQSVVKTVRL